MDKNQKKKLLKALRSLDPAALLAEKTKVEELLTAPGESTPEQIQEATDKLEVITELIEVRESGDADVETLQQQLDAANKRIAELEASQAQSSADEEEISAKMRKGLTREQAQHVIKTNRAHREIRFAAIGDAKQIKALFPDATPAEIAKAVKK